ncbi:MAG: MATE family efflux transporter [Clostridia bacterium]
MSVGANIVVSRFYGAKNNDVVSRAVQTSILISIISGLAIGVFGFVFSNTFLAWMGTPETVIDKATTYIQIYFIGMPASMVFNFGSSIMRAVGDTKRPLYYLSFAGIINIILNLLFVIVFHMDVAGVAYATIISQYISALLVLRCLIKEKNCIHLDIKKLHIYKNELFAIAKIGIPAGIQGSVFSVSNVAIQSSINAFGQTAIAGGTASASIENFIYTSMNSISQTSTTFVGQNYGARNYKRMKTSFAYCMVIVIAVGLVMGFSAHFFSAPLLGIYNKDPNVIAFGMERIAVICTSYCLCGILEVIVGMLRGMGYSLSPTLMTIGGVCVFRIVGIYTYFKENHTLFNLYLSYPISWIITTLGLLVCLLFAMKKVKSSLTPQ